MAKRPTPRLTVKVAGPAVGEARLAVRDLAEIATRLEQALKRVAQVLYGQKSSVRGRKKRDIEDLCALYLVSWSEGSAVVGFDFAEPAGQASLFGDIGENSLKAYLEGLEILSNQAPDLANLPAGFDAGVLQSTEALGGVLDHGIRSLSLVSPITGPDREIVYTAETRDRIQELAKPPAELGRSSKVGRLEELNGHDGLRGRLWEAEGTQWKCSFKQEHVDKLKDAWLQTVTIYGEPREGTFAVDEISIYDEEPISDLTASSRTTFWRSASLEALAEQQGVAPIADLGDLVEGWPNDEILEDPLDDLIEDRAARRRAANEGAV